MFAVFDPEGTLIRVIASESEYEDVVASHLVEVIKRDMPLGLCQETLRRLAHERISERLPKYKMILM